MLYQLWSEQRRAIVSRFVFACLDGHPHAHGMLLVLMETEESLADLRLSSMLAALLQDETPAGIEGRSNG
jgi:hypothetical protein